MSKTDFNRSPYFDDFDSSKNFMKVLYKPGYPVQARELNQTQSIFQNQIENFANHMFVNGSKVSNARTNLVAREYVRLNNGAPNVSRFPNGIRVVGVTSGVEGVLSNAVDATSDDPATIYVIYNKTGIDGVQTKFILGEALEFRDENNVNILEAGEVCRVRCPGCSGSPVGDEGIDALGYGQFFTVDEGVFYFEGMFIETQRQEIIVEKYYRDKTHGILNSAACKIGLDFVQTIVDYNEDQTLLDPSLGYPNSTAPGADRYKVALVLVKRPYDVEDGENFILLSKIAEDGNVEFVKSDSEYSDLGDNLAKRTFETNGDFTVKPYKIQFFQSKKQNASDTIGWSLSGSDDDLIVNVSSSIAYVKGYRVETPSHTPIAFPKARDTKAVQGFIKNFGNRTFILASAASAEYFTGTASAIASHANATRVILFDGVATPTSNDGTQIGSFRVSDVELYSGAFSDPDAVFAYYVYDIQMAAGRQFSEAVSFHFPTAYAGSDVRANLYQDPNSGKPEVYNSNKTPLIYRLDRDNIMSLRSTNDSESGSIDIDVRKVMSGTGTGAGFTFTLPEGEYFTGSLQDVMITVYDGSTTLRPTYGSEINVTMGPSALTVTSGSVNVNGATIHVVCSIKKTAQKERTKTIATNNFTFGAPALAQEFQPLSNTDVFEISSLVLKENGVDTGLNPADYFVLDKNITDYYYGMSRLRKIRPLPAFANPSLEGTYRYFQHSGSAGYFTVDSYKTVLADPDGLTYEELPVFKDANGNLYPAASSIDFRPDLDTNGEFVSPIFPANESTAIFDVEYYLPRTDILQVNKDGILYVKKGEPSETPRPPKPDEDAMVLYEIWMKPYVYSLKDVTSKFIENRRYTMRDIGNIDRRLQNVEYYTVLNLLEKSAADMSIKDDNGLDRFKNGFIADNFQDYQASDLTSAEWRAGVDRGQRELRPRFKSRNRKLLFDAIRSTGFVTRGNVAMLPYNEVLELEQPYATKHISVNPYMVFNQKGTMVLSPNNDVWSDDNRLPEMVIDIDTGVEAYRDLADAAGVLGTDWGTWVDQNRTTVQSAANRPTMNDETGWVNSGSSTISVTNPDGSVTVTTSTNQVRTSTNTTVDSRTDTYVIDDIVKDVQIIPYIRETVVQFIATRMRPNTRVYGFFNGEAVSEHCKDIGFQLSSSDPELVDLVEYGSPMYTDANGELRGEFRIPAGRFFTGEKAFMLSDDPNNSGDPDMVTTSASSVFFAGGLDVTKQDVNLNVISPSLSVEQLTETRVVTETSIILPEPEPTPPAPNPPNRCEDLRGIFGWSSAWQSCMCQHFGQGCTDPVAQSFVIDRDMFTSSLDLYFRQIDPLTPFIFVELRNTVNGYPGETILARKEYSAEQIEPFCSEDSTTAFRVEWDVPVFLEGDEMYAFVVGGYSPNTRIWVSRLGGSVVNMPDKIVEQQVYTNPSFRSLNGTTWNAEQYEQIKYRLHKASFTSQEMTLRFHNADADPLILGNDPLQFESGNLRFRIFAKDHGLTTADKVHLSVYDAQPFTIQGNSINDVPQVGHVLTTSSGGFARIYDVKKGSTANQYVIQVKDVVGAFNPGMSISALPVQKEVRDFYLAVQIGSKKQQSYTLNAFSGTVIYGLKSAKYPTGLINGVDADRFNAEFQVIEVDSPDSFVVTLPGGNIPVASGRFGGDGIVLNQPNHKYELFNVSGAYLPYRASERWAYNGIGHGDNDTTFASQNYERQQEIVFAPGEDRFLNQPFKFASSLNETMVSDAGHSVEVEARFLAANANTSPIVNLDTFSVSTVSNNVGWRTFESEVVPSNIALSEATINDANFDPNDTVNGLWKSEQNPAGGSEQYTYVTRTVNLAEGATELMIFVDVYKDISADFDVYVKFQRAYDNGSIDDKNWTWFDNVTKNRSSVDLKDFIEYELKASQAISGWDTDADPFISFKVKMVGRTTNSAKPPLFSALRCIAVT